jgi:predicted glycosyltransferase
MGYQLDVLESDEGAYEALRQHDDVVLIYGNRELFDPAATYPIPALPGSIRYSGRPAPATGREGLRR